MTRHSRNSCSGSVFTYAERARMAGRMGEEDKNNLMNMGETRARPGQCALCSSICVDPCCCPEGHLGCRECFLLSLLTQKKRYTAELRAYEQGMAPEAPGDSCLQTKDFLEQQTIAGARPGSVARRGDDLPFWMQHTKDHDRRAGKPKREDYSSCIAAGSPHPVSVRALHSLRMKVTEYGASCFNCGAALVRCFAQVECGHVLCEGCNALTKDGCPYCEAKGRKLELASANKHV